MSTPSKGRAPAKKAAPVEEPAPAVDDTDEPATTSVRKRDRDEPAPVVAAAAAALPAPVSQKQTRNKYVFYPDVYDEFDAGKISFAKDPQESRDGSGEILFMSYLFEDGLKPLMVQTPNAMHTPTGITVWKDGKCSILLSAGRQWEESTLMVKFKTILDSIQMRCIEVTCEKGWNRGGNQTPELVQESFTSLMFVGEEKDTGIPYPPSIKASVTVEGPSKTELFEKVVREDGTACMNGIISRDVIKGCGVTAIIHIPWIFRKKAKKGWSFSIRANLAQARVYPPTPPNGFNRGEMAVFD